MCTVIHVWIEIQLSCLSGLKSEGLYRISGFSDLIEDVKLSFDRGEWLCTALIRHDPHMPTHTHTPTHTSVCVILTNGIHMLTAAFFRSPFVLHAELWVYVMWNSLSCLNVKVAHLWEDFCPSVHIHKHYCFIMTLRWYKDSEREYDHDREKETIWSLQVSTAALFLYKSWWRLRNIQ